MKKTFLILVLTFLSLGFKASGGEKYAFYKNVAGWDLPKLEDFNLQGRRVNLPDIATDSSIANCSYQQYVAKRKDISITTFTYEKKIFLGEILYLEMKPYKLMVSGLTVYYYKDSPCCYEIGGKYLEDDYDTVLYFVDMDLDGKFELDYPGDGLLFFLKFSPKVAEEDRFKKPIWVGDKKIK